MRYINIENVLEGMVLGSDVYQDGNIVYKCGTVVTEKMIEYLKENIKGVLSIMDLNDLKPLVIKDKIFSRLYLNEILKDMNNILSSCVIDKTKFDRTDEELRMYLEENRKILFDLLIIRDSHKYTFSHSVNVSVYALTAGLSLGLLDNELHDLMVGALLHDIGKVQIPPDIIDKPSKLSDVEYKSIRQHPEMGIAIVERLYDVNNNVKDIILQHHEKLDGSGYPHGITEEKINPMSMVVSVCDIFDAVTSDRTYHKGVPVSQGAVILRDDVSLGKLNGDIVENFLSEMMMYPLNTYVKLSNGMTGYVCKESTINRPQVYNICTKKVFDLREHKDVDILEAV